MFGPVGYWIRSLFESMVLVVLSGLGSRRTHQGELHSSVRSWSSTRFGSDNRCSRTHAWRFFYIPDAVYCLLW